MLLLLAQLVAPPLQRGPARLPEPAPRQQPSPSTPANNDLKLAPESDSPAQPKPLEARPSSTSINSPLPRINGDLPYNTVESLVMGKLVKASSDEAVINVEVDRCIDENSASNHK